MNRRAFMARSLAAALAAQGTGVALASSPVAYPTRAIRFVVPTPPGNALDAGARILGDGLGPLLDTSVVVENRGGGMGIPGMLSAKQAAPDGYTVLIGASAFVAINPALVPDLAYDVEKDYDMISGLFTVGMALLSHPDSPYRTVQDVIDHARKDGGALNIAYGGAPGTTQHIAAEMFLRQAGIQATLVPYKGSAPAMTDLIGGHVPLLFDSLVSAIGQVRGGKVRAIAVASEARAPQLPDTPTFAEQGMPGFTALAWGCVMVPTGTPLAVRQRLSEGVAAILAQPAVAERMTQAGLQIDRRNAEAFMAFARAERRKYAEIIQAANIKPN